MLRLRLVGKDHAPGEHTTATEHLGRKASWKLTMVKALFPVDSVRGFERLSVLTPPARRLPRCSRSLH
jgi:hypothetical protein